ncbi:hypothetical protein HO133_003594 [Letharia lupina]|uniref:Uncharacterized protein n=1 Tax=Letharia lupina TaxID=560253 RepID=A0A8H6F9N1_9LECA|nr:uncharacterized protein HO133_003594 [Letharia lupina]KAF6219769.1 hypothetical protein HO133_003594 [Letharia lupina]
MEDLLRDVSFGHHLKQSKPPLPNQSLQREPTRAIQNFILNKHITAPVPPDSNPCTHRPVARSPEREKKEEEEEEEEEEKKKKERKKKRKEKKKKKKKKREKKKREEQTNVEAAARFSLFVGEERGIG